MVTGKHARKFLKSNQKGVSVTRQKKKTLEAYRRLLMPNINIRKIFLDDKWLATKPESKAEELHLQLLG